MFEPLTLLFEVRRPWGEWTPMRTWSRPALISVWHEDPCTDGTDSSCARRSPWAYRLHVWHWRVQVHALDRLKRWLWSRCALCGRRFGWEEAPISLDWDATRPRWFAGEKRLYHRPCAEREMSSAR